MAVSLVSTGVTFPDSSTQITAATGFGFKNRIINGAMVIDQRNAGASVTITNTTDPTYTLDRWQAYGSQASKFSVEQTVTGVAAPTGFNDYLAVTSSSAYSVISSDFFRISQMVEGFNSADFAWGTASAATVTLSFWVRSSLTGTFGGSFANNAYNRSYPFTYTISAANTWEQKTITVAGDTSGTWVGATNGLGIRINFGLGAGSANSGTAGAWAGAGTVSATGATSVVGTNGATFYITGVQLEKGSTATSFDYRPYGTELQLCQRYYFKILGGFQYSTIAQIGTGQSTTQSYNITMFPVPMRIRPTALETTGTATDYGLAHGITATTCNLIPTFSSPTNQYSGSVNNYVASGLTLGNYVSMYSNTANGYLAWSAEL